MRVVPHYWPSFATRTNYNSGLINKLTKDFNKVRGRFRQFDQEIALKCILEYLCLSDCRDEVDLY